MAYEYGTPNYDLPQTVPSDKRDWADTNIPFLKLDQDLHDTKVLAESLEVRVDDLEDVVDKHTVRLAELEKFIEDSEDGSKHEYESGNLFLKDGRVCIALTEIHEGHTLVEGQNYEVYKVDGVDLSNIYDAICLKVIDDNPDTNIAPGVFFWHDDELYVATTSILTSDTPQVGVNCKQVDLTTLITTMEFTWSAYHEGETNVALFNHIGGSRFWKEQNPCIALPKMVSGLQPTDTVSPYSIIVGDTLTLGGNYKILATPSIHASVTTNFPAVVASLTNFTKGDLIKFVGWYLIYIAQAYQATADAPDMRMWRDVEFTLDGYKAIQYSSVLSGTIYTLRFGLLEAAEMYIFNYDTSTLTSTQDVEDTSGNSVASDVLTDGTIVELFPNYCDIWRGDSL